MCVLIIIVSPEKGPHKETQLLLKRSWSLVSTCVGENLNQAVSMYLILYLMNMLAISNKIFFKPDFVELVD